MIRLPRGTTLHAAQLGRRRPCHRRACCWRPYRWQTSGVNGFTLVELLVSISIIALLASIALVGVQESGKVARTRSQIARLNALISEQWDSYLSRRVRTTPGPPRAVAQQRVDRIRELMRMELPDRKSDLLYPASGLPRQPALWRSYRRRVARLVAQHTATQSGGPFDWTDDTRGWTPAFQTAECLYLIISQLTDGDRSALAFFSDREVGDVDNDGVPELLDGWGNPIYFLRWAPGFDAPGSVQDRRVPDPLDPTGVYAPVPTGAGDDRPHTRPTFALYPLIFSSGSDGRPDLRTDTPDISGGMRVVYATTNPPNNPFIGWGPYQSPQHPAPLGGRFDFDKDGRDNSLDNIVNQTLAGGI